MSETPRNPSGDAFPWSGDPDRSPSGPPPGDETPPRPFLTRLVGVIVEPLRTMAEAGERPAWVGMLVLLMVSGVVIGGMMAWKVDFEEVVRTQIEASGREIPPEAEEQAVKVGAVVARIMAFAAPVVITPIAALLVALVLWGISRMISSYGEFRQHLSVVVHGWVPALVKSVLVMVLLLVRGGSGLDLQNPLPTNPAWFLGEDASKMLAAFLAIPDLFSLWMLFLLTLGVAAAARLSRGAAAAVVVTPWLVIKLLGAFWTGFFAMRAAGG